MSHETVNNTDQVIEAECNKRTNVAITGKLRADVIRVNADLDDRAFADGAIRFAEVGAWLYNNDRPLFFEILQKSKLN